MSASLPMYELPETRAAHDALYAFLSSRVPELPDDLTRFTESPFEALLTHWSSDALLLSQTCTIEAGLYRRDQLKVLATPSYSMIEEPFSYASWIVVRADIETTRLVDLRGRRVALNARTSLSGCTSWATLLPDAEAFFSKRIETGAHAQSIAAIRAGEADCAAIDGVTWGTLKRHRPRAIEGVRILARTGSFPAPPFVTRADLEEDLTERLTAALLEVAEHDAMSNVREALMIDGMRPARVEDYEAVAPLTSGVPDELRAP